MSTLAISAAAIKPESKISRYENLFNAFPSDTSELWLDSHQDDGFLSHAIRKFPTVCADSPALLAAAHALRFQVYCLERNFEKADEHPDGRETDAYDNSSIQGVLFQRAGCAAIGTVRLILPNGPSKDNFPIMQLLRANSLDLSDYIDVAQSVEVSRFAISKAFRQAERSQLARSKYMRRVRSQETDLAFLSLLHFALHESLKRGLLFWTAVIEPKFLRLLARYGVFCISIGAPIEYHGVRQPCYGYIPETLDFMRSVRPDCWDLLTRADIPRVGNSHSYESVPGSNARLHFSDVSGAEIGR